MSRQIWFVANSLLFFPLWILYKYVPSLVVTHFISSRQPIICCRGIGNRRCWSLKQKQTVGGIWWVKQHVQGQKGYWYFGSMLCIRNLLNQPEAPTNPCTTNAPWPTKFLQQFNILQHLFCMSTAADLSVWKIQSGNMPSAHPVYTDHH